MSEYHGRRYKHGKARIEEETVDDLLCGRPSVDPISPNDNVVRTQMVSILGLAQGLCVYYMYLWDVIGVTELK